jgi:hypothetical protein
MAKDAIAGYIESLKKHKIPTTTKHPVRRVGRDCLLWGRARSSGSGN